MRHETLFALTAGLALAGTPLMAAEGDYPAAHFEPQVVYQAETAAASAPVAEPVTADPNFPAASFTPKVIYQDPALIESVGPQTDTVAPAPASRAKAAPAPAPSRRTPPQGTPSDVSPPYTALLIALGFIALAFWWSRREAGDGDDSGADAGETGEETESEPAAEADPAAEDEAAESGEETAEALAEEAESQLSHQNRQRANKTKRTRRR